MTSGRWAHAARRARRHLRRRSPPRAPARRRSRALADAARRAEPDELEIGRRPTSAGRCASAAPASAGAACQRPARRPPTGRRSTVAEVDAAFERHRGAVRRRGRRRARRRRRRAVRRGPPRPSRSGCAALVTGDVRQGALDALMQEAVAEAADVPLAAVRRAAMLAGSTAPPRALPSRARRRWPRSGSRSAARCCRCSPRARRRRPTPWPRPAAAGGRGRREARRHPHPGAPRRRRRAGRHPQPRRHHRRGCPRSSTVARSLPGDAFVLDGEALALDRRRPPAAVPGDGVPHGATTPTGVRARRRTSSTCCTSTAATCSTPRPPSGSPRSTRWCRDEHRVRPAGHRRPSTRPRQFAREAARRGHEGVVVKDARRAVRRRPARRGLGQGQAASTPSTSWCSPSSGAPAGAQGWLSNIHLGARDRDRAAS